MLGQFMYGSASSIVFMFASYLDKVCLSRLCLSTPLLWCRYSECLVHIVEKIAPIPTAVRASGNGWRFVCPPLEVCIVYHVIRIVLDRYRLRLFERERESVCGGGGWWWL